jgi:hypothetical protein
LALEAGAYATINPAFLEPNIILPYSQASGAFDTLPNSEITVKLGDGDLVVYIKRLDLRTQMAAGQAAANQLPSCNIFASMISTATYLQRVNAQFDHHDTRAASHWGFSLIDAYRYAMWQAHYQFARSALLYGYSPVNGEGLLNGAGSFATTLPADPNGNSTITTIDNGFLAIQLLTYIEGIKARTNQLGIGRRFTILGPQRDIGQLTYPGIVQLTQFQRDGAGTATIAGMVKDTLMANGDQILWVYDDTLIGQGSGGTDVILIVMPEIQKPTGTPVDTNIFASLQPSFPNCTEMYCDMAAPTEIMNPAIGLGQTNFLQEWRVTSGWPVRPEAITVLSVQFP